MSKIIIKLREIEKTCGDVPAIRKQDKMKTCEAYNIVTVTVRDNRETFRAHIEDLINYIFDQRQFRDKA